MKKGMKRVVAVLAAALMALSLTPGLAMAATKTVKNVSPSSISLNTIRRSTQIKRGTTTLKFKKGNGVGLFRFTAKKSATYTFTFSGLSSNKPYTLGAASAGRQRGTSFAALKLKVSGEKGKHKAVLVENAKLAKALRAAGRKTYTDPKTGETHRIKSKATFRIKLKKGDTVFFAGAFYGLNSDGSAYGPVAAKMKVRVK